ncbi:cry2-2 [Populus alba x Populus x berolinensis]|uniref:Cry2-2 n=1 Tax=Populus alba x Populus x berolinensis TaxID=444605 RepID=A0AAD6MNT9_9ROSI|nr:cry2-2 [Populus alba x Populus x berolinensis]
MSSSKTIVWFRRDHRIEDNPALAASARDGCVFPVFIWCPKEGQFYPVGALLDSIETIGATTVAFNHRHVPVSLVRGHNIKEKLVELGIFVQSYNGDLLYEPWEIYDERGYAFTTFEAYRDKCSHMQMEPVSHLPPWRLVPAAGTIVMCSVEELGLEDEAGKSSNSLLGRGWSPGWGNADKALAEFVEQHLNWPYKE